MISYQNLGTFKLERLFSHQAASFVQGYRRGRGPSLAEASLLTCAPPVIPAGYLEAAPWVTYSPLSWVLNPALFAGSFSLARKHVQCSQCPVGGAGPGTPTHISQP